MSNCQNPFNIFSANFSSSIATEVIGDPAVTGIDAYSAIISDNSDARLTASYPNTTLKINVTGSLGIGLTTSTNTITLSNPWEKSDNNIYFNTGNVGLGVSDPDQKLEVSGAIHISSEGLDPSTPADGDGGVLFVKADGRPYWKSYDLGEVDLTSGSTGGSGSGGWTDDGSIIRLTTITDSVGIGVDSPSSKLGVSGSDNSTLLNIKSDSSLNIITVTGSGRIGLGTAAPSASVHINFPVTESAFRVDTMAPTESATIPTFIVSGSGDVGIGIAAPNSRLEVSGSDTSSLLNIRSNSNTKIFEISGSSSTTTHASSSVPISASSFWRHGVEITPGGTITALNHQLESRLVTIGSTTTELDGESALTYDGTTFNVSQNAGSLVMVVSGSNSSTLLNVKSDSSSNIFIVSGSGHAGLYGSGKLYFNEIGSNNYIYSSAPNTLTLEAGSLIHLGEATTIDSMFSSSAAVSASSFWKDGVELTGIGSVTALNNQAESRLVTIGSTTTELDGEANLTYDGATLQVSGSMHITGSIIPGTDNQYNLGSATNRWANLYTGDLHLKNKRGDWTIVEEEDFLCVINNKTGKKFKMLLQEIED